MKLILICITRTGAAVVSPPLHHPAPGVHQSGGTPSGVQQPGGSSPGPTTPALRGSGHLSPTNSGKRQILINLTMPFFGEIKINKKLCKIVVQFFCKIIIGVKSSLRKFLASVDVMEKLMSSPHKKLASASVCLITSRQQSSPYSPPQRDSIYLTFCYRFLEQERKTNRKEKK